MRRTLLVLLVVLAGAGVGACGGDEPERLTKEEFVKQGNAICTAGNERIEKAADMAFADATEEDPPSDEAILEFATDTVIPEVEKQVDAIDELSPPEDLESDVDAALTEARSAIKKTKADPGSIADDDDTTFDKANELIGKTGLDVCSEG